jgi:hypothetical protein
LFELSICMLLFGSLRDVLLLRCIRITSLAIWPHRRHAARERPMGSNIFQCTLRISVR